MTEQEAKTKWCPFARGMNDQGGNRVAYGGAGDGPVEEDYTEEAAMKFPCIGSACMAWRDILESDPSNDHPFADALIKVGGFCGLAGKP